MKYSNILVIGGNGYIGRHLKKKFPNFTYINRTDFDLKNKEEIYKFFNKIDSKKFDICIILSASITYKKEINFNEEPFLTNVIGLNNLLQILNIFNKNIKIIYFSSMVVYSIYNKIPVDENSKLSAIHSYGLSKIYAEKLLNYYNFRTVILRIPGIYGGDRKNGLIYNIAKKLVKNELVEIKTDKIGYWETLHIEDLIEMFSEFLEKYSFDKQYDIFNLSYGEKTDLIETVHFMKKVLNSNSIIQIDKNYIDMYLSNNKILQIVNKPMSYKKRLEKYLKGLF